MQRALKGVPETPLAAPDGVVSLRINGESGLRDDSSNVSEYFYSEFTPRSRDDGAHRAHAARAARRKCATRFSDPSPAMPRSTRKFEQRRSERRFAADSDVQQRTVIAQAAARLIAEHGITDWSMAKRKAARAARPGLGRAAAR